MAGTDGAFTAVAGTFDVGLHLAEAEVESYLGAVLSCHLSSVGGVLLRTTETHLTCTRPRDDLAFAVGERYDDIVERAVHVKLTLCVNLDVTFLCRDSFLCHSLMII